MMCNVLVSAQYYENYSDTDVPYWKPKGGADFTFPVDSDLVTYAAHGALEYSLAKWYRPRVMDMLDMSIYPTKLSFPNP